MVRRGGEVEVEVEEDEHTAGAISNIPRRATSVKCV
jgi:hypothetical protein